MKKYFFYNILFFSIIAFSTINSQWMKTSREGNGTTNAIVSYGQNVFVGTQSGGVYVSRDNGTTWAEANNGMPYSFVEIVSFVYTGGKLFAAIKYNGVYVSTDDGDSWQVSSNGLPGDQFEMQLAGDGDHIFLATDKGVFHSGDAGANWSAINSGLTDLDVRSIFINGQTLLCGTYNNGVFKSTLGSYNWVSSNSGIPSSTFVLNFEGNDSKTFAGTSGEGVYVSNDGGQNWTSSGSAASGYIIGDIEMNGSSLFCAIGSGEGGVLFSPDLGASWSMKNEGFSDYPYSTAIGSNTTTVFAALSGVGEIWKRALSDFVTGIDDESEYPTVYSLNQNYPNPFSKGSRGNPSTVISYQLPENGFVSLKVYDVLGNEIAALVNKEQSAGSYNVNFSTGTELAAGVYFYRFEAGNFVQTKKMLLLK